MPQLFRITTKHKQLFKMNFINKIKKKKSDYNRPKFCRVSNKSRDKGSIHETNLKWTQILIFTRPNTKLIPIITQTK